MKILDVNDIYKYYGKKENLVKAIDGISFSVDKGELITIMGPSGSGKSTLLNVLSTIDVVDRGSIYVNGTELSKNNSKDEAKFRREKLGFIFQDLNLLDTLTIYENIEIALTINKCDTNIIKEKINSISNKLGIENILNKYPYEVSGGQKQRCACARAIINNPDIIFADEPTGSLDSISSQKLMKMLQYINKEFEATIIIVTHDIYVASYCNRVLFIKDGKIFNEIRHSAYNRDYMQRSILDIIRTYELEGESDDLF